jgi:MFS family permease
MGVRNLASFQPLRHRDFSLLWAAGLISVVGSWMETVAVGALVTARTGEATWTVLVAASAFLPLGLFSPIGGALADRYSRRRALVIGNLVQVGLSSVLAGLVFAGRGTPLTLTCLVFVEGCVAALTMPFQQAILPDLVPRSEFLAASSLGAAQFNLGRIVGPALAGIAIAAFGYPVAFAANAVSFLAVVSAFALIRLRPPPGAGDAIGLIESMRIGAREAFAEPGCRAAITTITVVGLLGSPFIALVPYVSRQVQHGGPRALAAATGLLTTMQGVGAVIGALVIGSVANIVGRGRLLVGALVVLPPALAAYSFAPTLTLAAAAILLVGFVYIGVLSGLSTLLQLRAPQRYRGRILSIYIVALGVSYPIGSLIQGPLADRVGLRWTCGGAAALLACALGWSALRRPALWRALAEEVVLAPPENTDAPAERTAPVSLPMAREP